MFRFVRSAGSTRRIALAAASLVLATGVQLASPAPADAAITVTGFGNYCSVTNSSTGAWGFVSYPDGQDPCKVATSAGGMTIRRAGLYSANGTNNVVVRCNQDQSWVGYYRGTGNTPLGAAFNSARNARKSWCTFTVAPAWMGVLVAPFSLTSQYAHGTGFDFAKPPYNTLDVTQYGQTGSTKARIVDWRARDVSNMGFLDDHDGHDWMMPRGTPIKAAAAGVVVMARDWQGPVCAGQDSTYQKEVAIKHTVYGKNGYNEQFLTY